MTTWCPVPVLVAITVGIATVGPARAQAGPGGNRSADSAIGAPAPFYTSLAPVPLTLALNLRLVRGDTMDDPPSRAATITWRTASGQPASLPLTVKTRGRWRLTHCEFPPINFNFGKSTASGTPFEGVEKARLTSYCKNHVAYEQYVLQEMQLYRIYHLLTPYSHAVRAARITYVDSVGGRTIATRHAFLVEDRDALAARLHSAVLKAEGAIGSDLAPFHSALMGVFQYMIGNTDFLVTALHNVVLLGTSGGDIVPVAYDFDYAGAVNTIYAAPNSILGIRSVRERLFRGHCASPAEFQRVFDLFNERKAAIYTLYNDALGRLLRLDVVNETLKYFDEFYRVINTPALARSEIIDRCLK